MSNFNSLDVPNLKNANTDKLADAYAEEAVSALRNRYPDQVGQYEFERILAGAAGKARRVFLDKYFAEKYTGLHNDTESSAPGLVALITPEAVDVFMASSEPDNTGGLRPSEQKKEIEEINKMREAQGKPPLKHEIRPMTLSDIEWGSLQHRGSMPPFFEAMQADITSLYVMRLPAGAFRQLADDILFTSRATFQEGSLVSSDAWFSIPKNEVFEIQGAKGDYWKQSVPQLIIGPH